MTVKKHKLANIWKKNPVYKQWINHDEYCYRRSSGMLQRKARAQPSVLSFFHSYW